MRIVPQNSCFGLCIVLSLSIAPSAFGGCKIGKLTELPVTLVRNRPLIEGEVNGQLVKIEVDTGSSFSFIREGDLDRLGLKATGVSGITAYGVGGQTRFRTTVVSELRFGPFRDKNLLLSVLGAQRGSSKSDAPLILGEDFFSNFATEFDFGHGVLRLLKLDGCKPDQVAYWSDQYSLADIVGSTGQTPQIEVDVLINGRHVAAILDTGAQTSIISLAAAKNAGVTAGQGDTTAAGSVTGLDGNVMPSWVGTFGTFALGDESVRNVKLQIANLFAANTREATGSHIRQKVEETEMLIGSDFFFAHRVLVLYGERKLVFTYNGGAIFQTIDHATESKAEGEPEH